jgi:hypothetical protein
MRLIGDPALDIRAALYHDGVGFILGIYRVGLPGTSGKTGS